MSFTQKNEEFISMCLGGPLVSGQRKCCESIFSNERYTLIRSCNGFGKTALLAAVALNWISDHPQSIVLAMSKNMTHLQRNFMKEIRKQSARIPKWAGRKVSKFTYEPEPGRAIYALSPINVESAQGFHDPNVLVLVDEGTGIPELIYESLLSNMSGGNSKLVVTYNPVSPDTFVYKAENEYKWPCIALSALDHPNVVFGQEIVRGAITRKQVEEYLRTHSEPCDRSFPECFRVPWLDAYYKKTPQIAVRVLGEYHLINHDGFIDPAIIAESSYVPSGSWESHRQNNVQFLVGIDLSRGIKDRTIATILRHDGFMLGFEEFHETNLSVLASKIKAKFPNDAIALDDTTLGSGVTDRLFQLGHEHIYPVHFNSGPRNFYQGVSRPANARAEMYLLLEQQIRKKFLRVINDPGLHRELTGWKMCPVGGGTYCRVEHKSAIARRLRASPDKADSLALALYCLYIRKMMSISYIL